MFVMRCAEAGAGSSSIGSFNARSRLNRKESLAVHNHLGIGSLYKESCKLRRRAPSEALGAGGHEEKAGEGQPAG